MRIKMTIVGMYNFNEEIFDGFTVPEGVSRGDTILTILEKAGELPLLYPDWDFLKMMIGVWSRNEQQVWEKLQETVTAEYSPIENYDRTDTITRTTIAKDTGVNTNAQTAFNTDQLRNTDRSTSESSGTGTEQVSSRSHGNIGVTSAMELIQQQRDIVQFTVTEYITRSFIDRFCIEIY